MTFTVKRFEPPAPLALTGDYARDMQILIEDRRRLNVAMSEWINALEDKDAIRLDQAQITAPSGIIFPSGTMSDFVPWTSWTTTISASSGTFTTVSATAKYALIGGLYFIRVIITITTNGTAASIVRFTLPTTATEAAVFYGRETGSAGNQLQGSVAASSDTVDVVTYNNAYPGASGATLTISGFYL